jgi:dethiobiotin synthetase
VITGAVTPPTSRHAPCGLFVTGTDTGVGKTLVSCALLHAYANAGWRAVGMKPVAAGATLDAGVLVNEDVAALRAAGNVDAAPEVVNPYCFEPPIAPHIAAERAEVAIDIERIAAAHARLTALADRVVVEGAGGFRVPLGPFCDMSHVAQRLGLPVLMVVGMRLGCLNHALLTADAVSAAGLRLAGWVANHIDPDMMFGAENVKALEARVDAPLVARIPYTPHSSAAQIARHFDITSLDERTT